MILLAMMTVGIRAMEAEAKENLRILFVGGHSDKETFGTAGYDTLEQTRLVAERMASWEAYLEERFSEVRVINAEDYDYKMSADYDVTILDGEPKPIVPRKTVIEGGRYSKLVYAKYFPDDFDRPVITISDVSETVGRAIGVKNDWMCLCLDNHAYDMQMDHPIFKGPWPVSLTLTERPTPEGAKEYASITGEQLPETLKMWKVGEKSYQENHNYKIGMVSRHGGYLDSPDTEIISGGESAKSRDAIAIGRHAGWLHWGFAASPGDMTDEARDVFANAVVYISRFAGHRVIARKLNQTIFIREEAKANARMYSREVYDDYVNTIVGFNQRMRDYADSLQRVEAGGKQLSETEKQWILVAANPQPIETYEEYIQKRAGKLYEKFGNDVKAYAKYYEDNAPYFYGSLEDYGEILDEDAKSLGISNGDKALLDRAITLWQSGEDAAMGKRLLERYTLLRYETPEEWRKWFETYKDKLFFTESGGWLWLVDSLDEGVEGNDYGVLHFGEIDPDEVARVETETTASAPVAASSAVVGEGKDRELVIRLKIHPGFHIYGKVAEKDPYLETTFEFSPEGCELEGELERPVGRMLEIGGSIVYEGEVVLRQKFRPTVRYGGQLSCHITYQACNESMCTMPIELDVKAEF